MSKYIFLSFVLLFLYNIKTIAQTTQFGIVQEYNLKEKKTPLSNVELNIRSANSTVSDKDGKFTLHFLSLKPGDLVIVRRIEKLGYEIFNKEALEQWNINPTIPFTIVMCNSGKLKHIRDNYEKLASENYSRQLKKDQANLERLKIQGKIKESEFQEERLRLIKNYELQLDNLDSYVDHFSRIDLSEISAMEQEILELINVGNFEDAILKYDQLNIADNLLQELRKLRKIRNAISTLEDTQNSLKISNDSLFSMTDRHISTLMLAGGRENLNKIKSIYQQIADVDTTNVTWLLKTGSFIHEYFGDNQLAIHYYNQALQSFKTVNKDNLLNAIKTYNCIGVIYLEKGDGIKATEYFKKSAEYVDSVSTENVSDNLIVLLNNMSSVFSLYGAYDKASFFNQKALSLALSKYSEDNLYIADIYNNAAVISAGTEDYKKAFEQIDKAISIKVSLIGENSPSTITSIWNKGLIYKDKLDFDAAYTYLNKALVISKIIYPDNFYKLHKIYKDFTSLDLFLNFWDNNEKQIAIYEEFVDIQKHVREDSLRIADSYEKLTKLCINNKYFHKAIDYNESWYSIMKNFEVEDKSYEKFYYHTLSKIHESTGEMDKSIAYQNKIIEINNSLFGINDINTMLSYLDEGTLYNEQGNFTEAIYNYNLALNIQISLTGFNSKETASLLCILGYAYVSNTEINKALDCFNKALTIYEGLLDDPSIKLAHIYTSSTIKRLKRDLDVNTNSD